MYIKSKIIIIYFYYIQELNTFNNLILKWNVTFPEFFTLSYFL